MFIYAFIELYLFLYVAYLCYYLLCIFYLYIYFLFIYFIYLLIYFIYLCIYLNVLFIYIYYLLYIIIIYIYYLFTDTHASIRGTGGHLVECPMRSWDGLDSGTYMKGGHPWNVQQSHETVG